MTAHGSCARAAGAGAGVRGRAARTRPPPAPQPHRRGEGLATPRAGRAVGGLSRHLPTAHSSPCPHSSEAGACGTGPKGPCVAARCRSTGTGCRTPCRSGHLGMGGHPGQGTLVPFAVGRAPLSLDARATQAGRTTRGPERTWGRCARAPRWRRTQLGTSRLLRACASDPSRRTRSRCPLPGPRCPRWARSSGPGRRAGNLAPSGS